MDKTKLVERRFDFEARALPIDGAEGQELWVEGYDARFNSPTVLFEVDGIEYKEQIASDAFQECKMEDVIFNYNHSGRVMARTRNKTLQVAVDENGLFVRARLDGTDEGRSLYSDIQNGYVDRMSFRFVIAQEAYDFQNRTWTVLRIKRLYDVSAVDIPAYDDTSIEARKADAEAVAREHQRKVDTELARQKLELQIKLSEVK
jgi:HK97 family phage prohead protease